MTNFDEFVELFITMSITHIKLIEKDPNIIDALLEINEQEFYIRCWLAQRKLYFGGMKS